MKLSGLHSLKEAGKVGWVFFVFNEAEAYSNSSACIHSSCVGNCGFTKFKREKKVNFIIRK